MKATSFIQVLPQKYKGTATVHICLKSWQSMASK